MARCRCSSRGRGQASRLGIRARCARCERGRTVPDRVVAALPALDAEAPCRTFAVQPCPVHRKRREACLCGGWRAARLEVTRPSHRHDDRHTQRHIRSRRLRRSCSRSRARRLSGDHHRLPRKLRAHPENVHDRDSRRRALARQRPLHRPLRRSGTSPTAEHRRTRSREPLVARSLASRASTGAGGTRAAPDRIRG